MDFKIQQEAIELIAKHINERNNKPYGIPTVGIETNIETPQIFEIIPFDEIDNTELKTFAVDGSKNSHTFFNGVSIGLYRAGYICFNHGKQIRLNDSDDPIILGKSYSPTNVLVTCDEHLCAIYDEFLELAPVKALIRFLSDPVTEIFDWDKKNLCRSLSTLLDFCQDVLEWSLIYEIISGDKIKAGDFVLKDGPLRSLNIKQKYLVKLGKCAALDKDVRLIGITKKSSIKLELSYTFKQIDSYLQDKLRPKYPFKQKDPLRQKLCAWFEVSDPVLTNAYQGGGMFAHKGVTGGRGTGLFFAARLDYVEKLQNYDWLVADLNVFDAIPGIEQNNQTRDINKLKAIFFNLTRLTQEHYILGYPYPLVEVHNFVTLKKDLQEEVINRVKHSMYQTQHMDNIDIENMFLDIHSRF
ncbi:MAG: hypothetical protein JW873_03800 [Candidatus Saganbacteria bacterium]|nr:hypothetical protein [Candidatus Saganbacteria bacterium]